MRKRIEWLTFLAGLLALLISPPALALFDDLAVSKNRFVISLDKSAAQLMFLDTWNWRILNPPGSDPVNLYGTVNSLDLTPKGTRLYFAYNNGAVRWMDLAPLHALRFNEPFEPSALELETGTTFSLGGGAFLNQIAALQDSDSATKDCVFLEVKNAGLSSLTWLLVSGNSVEEQASGYLLNDVANLEMAKSRKRLFVKFKNAGNSWLYAYRCFSGNLGNIIQEDDLEVNSSVSYQGIAANNSGTVLILGNQDQAELWPYEIAEGIGGSLIALPGTPYDRLSAIPASQIWLTKISAEPGAFVFFTQGNTLMRSSLNKNSAEFKADDPKVIENFPASPLVLANSSPGDGYIYIAPQGLPTFSIFTDNPWILNLALATGGTITTETFKVKFNTDVNHSFYTIGKCLNFAISPSGCGPSLATGELKGSTAEVSIKSRDLGEGTHILGVFLRDKYSWPYHQGRNALRVKIDLPPPPQEFEMGFGDEKIFIKFQSPDLEDLKKYLIYYGTNCGTEFYKPGKIDETGGTGDPPSPIEIKDPEPDKDYEKVVEKLVNGTQYCAQIVLIDSAENKSYSERNYATPEETKSPSDEAGEEGGLDCLGDISGKPRSASVSEIVLLILPLMVLLILKIKLRSKE